jgi:hypothetical protein
MQKIRHASQTRLYKCKRDGVALLVGDKQVAECKEKNNTKKTQERHLTILIWVLYFSNRLLKDDWRSL